jgi:hypothetical protein
MRYVTTGAQASLPAMNAPAFKAPSLEKEGWQPLRLTGGAISNPPSAFRNPKLICGSAAAQYII